MEFKRYVLFTDKMIYQYNKRSGLYHNMNEDKACVYGLNIKQELVEKTSDDLIDLVEIGDLVKAKLEDGFVVVKVDKQNNFTIYTYNDFIQKRFIVAIYKLQPNGDYKRYLVDV